MHPKSSVTRAVLLLAISVLPIVQGAISIGEQKREGGLNYIVAWHEGLSPCVGSAPIISEGSNACGHDFILDGITYFLEGCDPQSGTNQNPKIVRRRIDKFVYGNCRPVNAKLIMCVGSPHDAWKHYICG
jgi:hypothetical protein